MYKTLYKLKKKIHYRRRKIKTTFHPLVFVPFLLLLQIYHDQQNSAFFDTKIISK